MLRAAGGQAAGAAGMAGAVSVAPVPGKGLGVVAARPIRAGEAVFADYPRLLTPAWECRARFCALCLRDVQAGPRTPLMMRRPLAASPDSRVAGC